MKPIPARLRVAAAGAAAVALAGGGVTAAFARPADPGPGPEHHHGPPTTAIYDSTVSPLPGNIPSVGVEAYAYNELGNEINLAATHKPLDNVVVTMSSWACQSGGVYSGDCSSSPGATYQVPITFTLYNPGAALGTVGSVIATDTHTFNIPYRPTFDSSGKCPTTEWYDPADQSCNHGIADNITFDFSSQHVKLPPTVVYGISYSSDHFGPHPTNGSTNPADSLNIGLTTSSTITTADNPVNPSVGADTDPGNLFINSAYASNSNLFCNSTTPNSFVETFVWCDNALGTTGANGRVTGAWDLPAVQFNVKR